jgi:hypothetical protein
MAHLLLIFFEVHQFITRTFASSCHNDVGDGTGGEAYVPESDHESCKQHLPGDLPHHRHEWQEMNE